MTTPALFVNVTVVGKLGLLGSAVHACAANKRKTADLRKLLILKLEEQAPTMAKSHLPIKPEMIWPNPPRATMMAAKIPTKIIKAGIVAKVHLIIKSTMAPKLMLKSVTMTCVGWEGRTLGVVGFGAGLGAGNGGLSADASAVR